MTGEKQTFSELLEWRELADERPDDDASVLAQWKDGEVHGAYLDGDTWCGLDAMPVKTPPVRWAEWPRGRA